MVSPTLFMEDPMFLEATLLSSPHTKSSVGHSVGKGMVIPSSGGCILDDVSSIPVLGDNPVNIGGLVQGPVMCSNRLPMGDVPSVEKVCITLPREASPRPSAVVFSDGTIMAPLSSGDPNQSVE
ncbi:hypothetical protein LWI28_005073 [Acer negundo]|uniref:Uncharacterized protein n=1 Tax=Acer negundo TaxID=4023 RepID=A0AAD5ITQ3_ACENE|nr:hypothetical protein LWI28_005073 [Acer negundo]